MMLFALLKKDFLIVKKYVLFMLIVAVIIPPFMLWRAPEFTGVLGFMLSVIFVDFMLLQYVSLKEYQFPKAATLLCAMPFPRKMMVLSKYIFCMAIYVICCIIFGIETLIIPKLGTSNIKLFALMFLVTSVLISVYLPIQYKLGYEKTRFAFVVVYMASPVILPLLMKMEILSLNFLSMFSPFLVNGGIVIIGFVVLVISAYISTEIYDKADLA
ncbi:MAG: ABC-2 transporter permease [Acetatifactor sp.]|nr:ABC-2 transporter permease [Acetatifactor sp.]